MLYQVHDKFQEHDSEELDETPGFVAIPTVIHTRLTVKHSGPGRLFSGSVLHRACPRFHRERFH